MQPAYNRSIFTVQSLRWYNSRPYKTFSWTSYNLKFSQSTNYIYRQHSTFSSLINDPTRYQKYSIFTDSSPEFHLYNLRPQWCCRNHIPKFLDHPCFKNGHMWECHIHWCTRHKHLTSESLGVEVGYFLQNYNNQTGIRCTILSSTVERDAINLHIKQLCYS